MIVNIWNLLGFVLKLVIISGLARVSIRMYVGYGDKESPMSFTENQSIFMPNFRCITSLLVNA